MAAASGAALRSGRKLLISGGTGSGKTTLLNALVSLLPAEGRILSIGDTLESIGDTLELRLRRANCVRFGARGLAGPDVTIRDLVRHALRHRPDHIVVGEVRGAEAAGPLQALNTGHGGSLATVHANNAAAALSRVATCAMQASDALPWGGRLPGRRRRHRGGDPPGPDPGGRPPRGADGRRPGLRRAREPLDRRRGLAGARRVDRPAGQAAAPLPGRAARRGRRRR